MSDPRFNLLDDPWLEVFNSDGSVERVGILEAFLRAEEVRGLAQDLSTQRFAVLRVLLAFLHRALGGPTGEGWEAAWERGLPIDQIETYAQRVRDRFWLVHPTAPFFQTPSLRASKGPEHDLRKIIADLPDGEMFFTNRSLADARRVPWQEAAVWVVHAQAYDTAGIKTGAEGDPLVIKGKGYGYGLPAWAGQIGGISAQGNTLRETMLLNLIPTRASSQDLPPWEREVPTSWRGGSSDEQPAVSGPVHLMTWQARRLLLKWDGANAVGLTLSQGDRITPQQPPMHLVENMTGWRYSDPQTKKYGYPVFMPQLHDPARQAWRGVTRLLGLPEPPRPGNKAAADVLVPRSGLVEWLSELRQEGIGPPQIRIELAGYEYGGQNATFAEVVDDSMAVPSMLLGDGKQAAPWQAAVGQAIGQAEQVASAVRRYAENLAVASGQDRAQLPQWQQRCFAELDPVLRSWIAGLRLNADLAATRAAWQHACRRVAIDLADELQRNLGPHAHAGHSPNPDADPVTPAKASIWLYRALSTILPLTAPEPSKEGP